MTEQVKSESAEPVDEYYRKHPGSQGDTWIMRGNALDLPLPDDCVDLIVTSPPYFGLRSYQDGGEHYDGQIGAEATPAEFVDALIAATREMVRVLKPTGSIWVNLGDKYSAHPSGDRSRDVRNGTGQGTYVSGMGQNLYGIRPKSLMGIPWRYALRCIDELGLILRAEVIWCLSGGAKVYARTSTGDRPVMLRDLVRSYRPEDVQLWNGEKWTQALGWSKTPDDDGALELELRTGERIGCTPGHQWPTQRGVIRADEVRVGDVIETTRLPEPEQPSSPAFLPDRDIGWLVGLYIAEGSRSERMVQIAGHVDESARHARLAAIAEALDGKCNVYQNSDNGSTCNLSGSVILGVIDRYVSNGTAKTKRLRHAAWQRSDDFLAAVVEGYLSGDGHHDVKNDRWRLGFCANDEWAADLRTLAARLGAKISLRRTQHVGNYGTFPGWRGEWRWTRSSHHNAKHDGEVVAVRKSRARDFYDLGVADEPHLFALASGVLTHNSKPNGLPESVTDRVRRSHEQWFHFTKEPRYYSAVDEIREQAEQGRPQAARAAQLAARHGIGEEHRQALLARGLGDQGRSAATQSGTGKNTAEVLRLAAEADAALGSYTREFTMTSQSLGKLPGSVWTIPTEPLRVPEELGIDHFAAFPTEWPRRIITGWSPREVCTVCNQGRRDVWEDVGLSTYAQLKQAGLMTYGSNHTRNGSEPGNTGQTKNERGTSVTYEAKQKRKVGTACACPEPTAPTTPGVVLDPFGGTGTTALVADALGRHGISVDMSADYCRLAEWRTTDPQQRAKAARRPFVPPVAQVDGQASLLDLLGGESA